MQIRYAVYQQLNARVHCVDTDMDKELLEAMLAMAQAPGSHAGPEQFLQSACNDYM
jgi:hypothetical protein